MAYEGPWDELTAQIATCLTSEALVGNVYLKQRYLKRWDQMLDEYKWRDDARGFDTFRGWEIIPAQPVATSEIMTLGSSVELADRYRFEIRGLQAVSEANNYHNEFMALSQRIKTNLDVKQDFTVATLDDVEGLIAESAVFQSFVIRTFGGVACWTTTITRTVTLHRKISMSV